MFMNNVFFSGILRQARAGRLAIALVGMTLAAIALSPLAKAQDQDDPPGRVARLGYMEGSVSFQPAGENEWVEAAPNRPMTTGDKLWADKDSRAEVQLGSSMIDLAPNTGFSFLNLDDHTIQMEVTAGAINIRVWSLDPDNVFEIDTPNQAFTVTEAGRYRVETSDSGDYTVVTIREGAGESTGNGQGYTLHAGQRTTFSGTTTLNADVEQIGGPDDFDNWSDRREHRYDDSPSAHYVSRRVVGFEDLDENGDWQPSPEYGHVWFPRVDPGWAPYHYGHWAWIDPWGWTWVDDARWGYAPFHYGRWVNVYGRWGWIPGPVEERPVYAPALVVFVGGGPGAGGNVAWFPLGPREVFVPAYRVSPTYVNRVNISSTNVSSTTVTNVYNTTVINKTTTITNVTYVNRSVQGGTTAMPQQAFASAQPVAKASVAVNQQELARAPVMSRAAVAPAPQAVLGPRANAATHVAAPPAAVASRQVIAKTAPPPPPPSFASRQQALTQHPGQPVARQEMAKMAPPSAAAARVKVAPPSKPATATPAPANQPGNRPGAMPANASGRPQPNTPQPNHPAPANRSAEPPARNDRPVPQPNNRPEPNQPAPNNRPAPNNASPNRPVEPPARNDHPAAQPNNRPEPNQPAPNNRPQSTPPAGNNRPSEPAQRNDRPPAAQPNNHPAQPPAHPANKPPKDKDQDKKPE